MSSLLRSRHVPRLTTSFVGRDDDLQRIDQSFARGERLVTLLGPPGVGKTRLARRYVEAYAERVAAAHGGDAWACELAGVRGVGGFGWHLSRLLDAPGPPPGRGDDAVRHLGRFLARRGPLLLLLDNVEHLAGVASATVGALLDAAPELRLLVTSRRRLRLAGETLRDVAPLPLVARAGALSAAAQLFFERARAVREDVSPDVPADVRAADAIVRHLDGLPLAIELAAARCRVLTPSRLWRELKKSLDVLEAGPCDAAPRHRTLWHAIACSWNLLSAPEREALRQASVFRGGLSFEAAEAVLDLSAHPGAPSTLNLLAALCDQSLLYAHRPRERPDDLRYGVYESVREYAAARRGAGGAAEATANRHARYFVELFGREPPSPVIRSGFLPSRELLLETENLLAAYHWAAGGGRAEDAAQAALALGPPLVDRGLLGPYLSLVDEVLLDGAEGLPPTLRVRALLARGEVLLVGGRFADALACWRRARDEARAAGARSLELHAFFSAVTVGTLFDVPFGSRDELERALVEARATNDRLLEARALSALGIFELVRATPSARDFIERAQRLSSEAGERNYAVGLSAFLGLAELLRDRPERARLDFAVAHDLWRREGDRWNAAFCLLYWGVAAADAGQFDEAIAHLERARALHAAIGDRAHEGLDLCWLARAAAARDDLPRAQAALTAAEALQGQGAARALEVLLELGRGHLDLATARRSQAAGEGDDAARHLAAALGRVGRALALASTLAAPSAPRHELSLARRSLERAIAAFRPDAPRPTAPEPAPGPSLELTADARRFRPPGGAWVDFSKRTAPRLVLKCLVEQHRRAPGHPLSLHELLGAGWPGQRPLGESGSSRVYMALYTLRKSGLEGLVVRRDDGYMIEPGLRVSIRPADGATPED